MYYFNSVVWCGLVSVYRGLLLLGKQHVLLWCVLSSPRELNFTHVLDALEVRSCNLFKVLVEPFCEFCGGSGSGGDSGGLDMWQGFKRVATNLL